MNKPNSISIQQAIQKAEKEIKRIADAESDPMLRDFLLIRTNLSISNIADSIEKKYLEGSVVKQSDGAIDPERSTMTFDILQYVRSSLEKEKKEYLSRYDNMTNPADILVENVHGVIAYYSIRKEWDLWAAKQQLLASEAIPLMNGLDPLSWEEYEKKEKQHLPYEMIQSIKRSLVMAEDEKIVVGAPAKWLDWGRKHDLDKPILKSKDWLNMPDVCMFKLFETAVNGVSGRSINSQTTEKQKDDSWKEMAREKAELIYQKQKEIGCDPSKLAIADLIAKEFEKEGIQTSKRKRLNGSYIRRHALNTWNRPKK